MSAAVNRDSFDLEAQYKCNYARCSMKRNVVMQEWDRIYAISVASRNTVVTNSITFLYVLSYLVLIKIVILVQYT